VNFACHIGHVCHRFVSPALVGQSLIIIEASWSHTDTPRAVGLLWTNEEPDTETSTCQHTTLTRGRHPCLRQDSNPHTRKRAVAESCLRPWGHWDWWKATISYIKCLCLSVHPHGTSLLPLDGFLWNLLFEHFSKVCWEYSSAIKIWQE
jgi:hypothetical protein